jgi:hypothetical protein
LSAALPRWRMLRVPDVPRICKGAAQSTTG